MNKVIIAVDAGGTKTKVVALNENKEIVYETIGGPGSPASVKEEALKNITELVLEVYNNVKDEYIVSFVQMGLSGFGVLKDVPRFENEISNLVNCEVSVRSDADLGLYSIIEDKYEEGILVISGTGSVVAGINHGKILMVGGYGVLLTETGSSYASVKMLVTNIIHRYEETLTFSKLGSEFMELLGAKDLGYFRIFMYRNTKAEIADYSKFISKKALEGDEEAIDILKQSGMALADSVRKIYKNLNISNDAILGFRGSFINKAPYVKEELLKTLEQFGINLKVYEGSDDPIYGAYYMAKRKGKI